MVVAAAARARQDLAGGYPPPWARTDGAANWLSLAEAFVVVARLVLVHLAAQKLRSEKADRLVLACESCPKPVHSKRKPIRWDRLGALFGIAGAELQEAWRAERERE